MAAVLPLLDQLPRHTSSTVKNKWRDVVRDVHQSGSVAITNHQKVEMVLVDAATYEQLAANAAQLHARERSALDELTAQFDARLASLQAPDAGARVGALFGGKGKLARARKAGPSY